MRFLFILIVSLHAYAQGQYDLCKIAEAEGKRQANAMLLLPPSPEQQQKIMEMLNELTFTMSKDKQLIEEIKNYYHLLDLRKGGPEDFNQQTWPMWQELKVSQDSPQWKIDQIINDYLKNVESSIGKRINQHLKEYMVDPLAKSENRPKAIISSAATYNEVTITDLLLRSILPLEKNRKLKTYVTVSPDQQVSTSILITYHQADGQVFFKAEDIRRQLFEHLVKRNLSQGCRKALTKQRGKLGINDNLRESISEKRGKAAPRLAEPDAPALLQGKQQ